MLQAQDRKYGQLNESEMMDIREISLQEALFEIDILRHQLKMSIVESRCWKECYESSVQSIIKYVK